MKKLPLGMQCFREIIEGGYVYVDKTKYIYNLINNVKYYFLSRPRRFGKSLLLDTIAEAMSGNKELFKDLFIYDSDYNFEKHPVLRIDMSNIANKTPEVLENELSGELNKRVKSEGFDFEYSTPSAVFKNLIEALCKKYDQRVVVLIDEYDKPILDHIINTETAEANRKVLSGFYGVMKSLDQYLRLTFITGVTKFTKTSIFSEMNNLLDLTLTKKYSNICGITVDDLAEYFGEHIENLATLNSFRRYSSIHDEILAWYDGYSWDGETRVINPFSLLSFFAQKRFSSYWYSSGNPKFLLDLIKKRPAGYTDLRNLELDEWSLDACDINNMAAGPLLFQTGYLTVKEVLPYDPPPVYLLDIPNYEVSQAFNLHIISEFTEAEASFAQTAYRRMNEALQTGNLQGLLITLRSLFASIPYELHIGREAYYHSIFYAIMNVLGFDMDVETSVSGGRVDAVLEQSDKVYIFEFKYMDCPPDAVAGDKQELFEKALEGGMRQIESRGYAKKYAGSGKTIYKAVFAFLGRDNIEIKVKVGG